MEVLRIVVSLLRFGPFLCLLALLTLCVAVNFQDPQRNICNWGSPWTQVVAIHRSHTRKCFMILWYFHIFPEKQWLDPILSLKASFSSPIQMGLEGYPQFTESQVRTWKTLLVAGGACTNGMRRRCHGLVTPKSGRWQREISISAGKGCGTAMKL
jgi:hypothetical protein